jgi:hypothetical protein
MALDVNTLAKPFVDPVSAEAPAGANARFDPRYEKTVTEIAKLESPAGGPTPAASSSRRRRRIS